MEQMYMVEIFIDKVTIFIPEGEDNATSKKLTMKVKFGPKTQFIIKEGQLANPEKTKDVIDTDEKNRRKFTRTIRVGKSMLFPSYPDTVLKILSQFPLEIEVWNDDDKEEDIFVGIGTMQWDTAFFFMLKDAADACKRVEPLSVKQVTTLMAECCCKQVGEVQFILRLSALGDNIITEFQQLVKNPESFVFRTNRSPSMFQCKRIEDGDPNFVMIGSIYETTTLEDPTLKAKANDKIEICTQLQSCGVTGIDKDKAKCEHGGTETKDKKKTYAIDKIRMGDITGPCGNTNCALAHKVKTYIRNLDVYKKEAAGKIKDNDIKTTKNVCGACICKDDRWHREECTESKKTDSRKEEVLCKGCGGHTKPGHTCEEVQDKSGGKAAEKATVAYITDIPNFKSSLGLEPQPSLDINSGCGCSKAKNTNNIDLTDYIYPDLSINDNVIHEIFDEHAIMASVRGCGCGKARIEITEINENEYNINDHVHNMADNNNPYIYNVTLPTQETKSKTGFNGCSANPEKDCACDPPKPKPLCSTFDCECIPKSMNLTLRKQHKPYCPLYKHKSSCPVSRMHDEQDEEKKKNEEDEDEQEPLPYGLPPIALGPCPVMGRPCTVPDGFARIYKTAEQAPLPPSYGVAGKVCCSKEFERIKKALKEYMKYEKDSDFRCVNKFDLDTERRCCDKEQMLMAMTGKACCGSHKIAIQEKFKENKN